ncbi:MAG: hypothetical protein OEZ58_15365 [Gammaproteobacteria bacterium]|nr:hypothetical protein [Gammaproteobacteria bacterium]MDH5730374.1 hypothetical protein [Gammaproteobacteria bacterium]
MILPSLFTVLSNDIQSNTLDLGLATRYYFNNSKFQHFAQIGNVHALKIDTINLEPKAGYAFRNISTRYGIERLLSNHVSIEGAIEFVANFESTRITYRYPFWRLGMSYFW